jgi:hypothetical protein
LSLINIILNLINDFIIFIWFLELSKLILFIIYKWWILFGLLWRQVIAIFIFLINLFIFILIIQEQLTIHRLLFYNEQIHCILLVHLFFPFSFNLMTICLYCIIILLITFTHNLWLKFFILHLLLRYFNLIYWLFF